MEGASRASSLATRRRSVEQIDDKTFRVEIGGASKFGGLVTLRANRATRFELIGGVRRGRTLYGSLGNLRIGATVPIAVTLGPVLPDGSYRLLQLTTMTR